MQAHYWSFALENVPPYVIARRVTAAWPKGSPYRLVRQFFANGGPATRWRVIKGDLEVGELWTFEATAELVMSKTYPKSLLEDELFEVHQALKEMR